MKRDSPEEIRLRRTRLGVVTESWEHFSLQMGALSEALGSDGVELVRVSVLGSKQLEDSIGVAGWIKVLNRFQRQVTELLPPHFPLLKLPTAELLIAVDSMMSSFFCSQILQTATAIKKSSPQFTAVIKRGTPLADRPPNSLEELLAPVERVRELG